MLATDEFIRRFLLHVHPRGFHRIRHYGLLDNHQRVNALAKARALLNGAAPPVTAEDTHEHEYEHAPTFICPACGAPMIVIEHFARGHTPRAPPTATGSPYRTAPTSEKH